MTVNKPINNKVTPAMMLREEANSSPSISATMPKIRSNTIVTASLIYEINFFFLITSPPAFIPLI